MNRGDIYDADLPSGRRPAVIVTRDIAIPFLRNVTVAPITGTRRGLPTEVPLDRGSGLARESCASCDNLATVSKDALGGRIGTLGPADLRRLDDALRIALGLD